MRVGWRWRSPAHSISGINFVSAKCSNHAKELRLVYCLDLTARGEVCRPSLGEQPVDKKELESRDSDDQQPHPKFPDLETALGRRRQPELHFGGAERNDVAVTQAGFFLRLIVDGGKGIRSRLKEEAVRLFEIQNEVVVPDAGVVEDQIIFCRAPDAERKTADDLDVARHFARKD